MKIALVFVAILSLSSASNASDFFNGLLTGLEANPASIGKCGAELKNIVYGSETLYKDIMSLIKNEKDAFLHLVDDSYSFNDILTAFSTDCDLTSFFKDLSDFLSEAGMQQMFQAYMHNVAFIDSNVENILQCSKSYSACGNSLGVTIRTLTGATLNAKKNLRSDSKVNLLGQWKN